jgi:hypothetical protein
VRVVAPEDMTRPERGIFLFLLSLPAGFSANSANGEVYYLHEE